MRPHHRARALAIDVQVADVELAAGALDLVPRARVDSAREAELGVVGNFKRVVEAARFDDREHRAEDLFLLELGIRWDVRENRGLDEVPFAGFGGALAAGEQASIFLALLDVAE